MSMIERRLNKDSDIEKKTRIKFKKLNYYCSNFVDIVKSHGLE